jgi:transposase
MRQSKAPYLSVFRQQIIELVQAGKSAQELSKEFGCCTKTIQSWVAQASIAQVPKSLVKAGLSATERGAQSLTASSTAVTNGARYFGKGYGLVCRQRREDVHSVFELMMVKSGRLPSAGTVPSFKSFSPCVLRLV